MYDAPLEVPLAGARSRVGGGAALTQREGASPSTAYPDRNSWTADAAVGAVS